MFKKRTFNSSSRKKSLQLSQPSDSDSDSDEDPVVIVSKKPKSNKPEISEKAVDIGAVQHEHSHSAALKDSREDATKENRLYIEAKEAERAKNSSEGVSKRAHLSQRPSRFGPVKATAGNVHVTTVVDYQPDVCKDYKLTGFCGYGDSCKFLHSREDYKAGWKLDQEWEEAQLLVKGKGKKDQVDGTNNNENKKEEEIPFKCVICKNDYKNPVVTNCRHYFCESCFLTEYRRKPGCFICGKETNGVAKPAKGLQKLLSRRKREE